MSGKKIEVILYLSNGYPSIEASMKMAEEYADAGCTMIEVDFPSRNPFLEGKMIADRMKTALVACGDYKSYMKEISEIHRRLPQVKILVMIYENTIQEIGEDNFIQFCRENNLKDIILVGLTSDEVKEKCMKGGLRVSCYVQYQMQEDEVESAISSNGFVYMQAKPKQGQGYVNEKYPELKDCIRCLREKGIDRPVYCGVGVSSPEDIAMIKNAGGDGAFVGSTVLNLQNNIPAMKAKIRELISHS
jgi:tryptophan synthase alpha chain